MLWLRSRFLSASQQKNVRNNQLKEILGYQGLLVCARWAVKAQLLYTVKRTGTSQQAEGYSLKILRKKAEAAKARRAQTFLRKAGVLWKVCITSLGTGNICRELPKLLTQDIQGIPQKNVRNNQLKEILGYQGLRKTALAEQL